MPDGVRTGRVLQTRGERVWLVALSALALGVRLGFLVRLPALPLYWDETYYDVVGKMYMDTWQALATFSPFLPKLRVAFQTGLQKGEVYHAFVGVIYALTGAHAYTVFVVQVIQGVLDTLTCAAIYCLARLLAGAVAARWALLLAAVYPPLVFAAARIQTETFAALLCTGALCAFVCRGWRTAALSGFLLALTMLTRPAYQFLVLLWLPLAGLGRSRSEGGRVARTFVFAAGFLAVIGPWLLATDLFIGRPVWSGTTDPSINSYAGIVFDNLGWRTDHNSFNSRGELPAVLQERGRTEPGMNDYRVATARTWERHPLESAAVLLHKTYTVWRHPYNDSRRTFILGLRGQRWLHQAMLVLAAIGLPLLLRRWRMGVPVVLTILYCWLTYFSVQIEVRYMVTAMPLKIACAGVALAYLGTGMGARVRNGKILGTALALAATVVPLLLLHAATLGRLTGAPFQLSPRQAYDLHRGLAVVVILASGALVFNLLAAAVSRWWALAAAALPCVGGMLIFLVGGTLANIWHQWACPLRTGSVVQQEFVLPASLAAPARAEIWFDLTASGSEPQRLVVDVNGHIGQLSAPGRDNAVAVERFYNDIFAGQGRAARPWHAWYAAQIDPLLLAGTDKLRVEARLEGNGTVTVFGDYAVDDAVYDGPSPLAPESSADTSVYKYLSEGDFRMRRRYPLAGDAVSMYFDGQEWRSDDLSPLPGRQFGRYRILLKLRYANGQVVLF